MCVGRHSIPTSVVSQVPERFSWQTMKGRSRSEQTKTLRDPSAGSDQLGDGSGGDLTSCMVDIQSSRERIHHLVAW